MKKTAHQKTKTKKHTALKVGGNIYLSTGPSAGKIFLACFMVIITALTLFNLSIYLTNNKKVEKTAIVTSNNNLVLYWQGFLAVNRHYFPGWIELAKLEIENNNFDSAINALNAAKSINPNSSEVKNLNEKLEVYLRPGNTAQF